MMAYGHAARHRDRGGRLDSNRYQGAFRYGVRAQRRAGTHHRGRESARIPSRSGRAESAAGAQPADRGRLVLGRRASYGQDRVARTAREADGLQRLGDDGTSCGSGVRRAPAGDTVAQTVRSGRHRSSAGRSHAARGRALRRGHPLRSRGREEPIPRGARRPAGRRRRGGSLPDRSRAAANRLRRPCSLFEPDRRVQPRHARARPRSVPLRAGR